MIGHITYVKDDSFNTVVLFVSFYRKEGVSMKFTKMHGLGNDYIYLDCTVYTPDDLPALARKLSDRHFGVGGDGLICICPSETADFRMRMFNADGSEGAMCGNGIRCLGKLAYDKGLTRKRELSIETASGEKRLLLQVEGGSVVMVTVDMGVPIVEREQRINVKGKSYTGVPVSVGNPHFVVPVSEPERLDLAEIGPVFEHFAYFPDRTNTEFVRILNRGELFLRVWERGSGETMACGTGACAAAAALAAAGLTNGEVLTHLPGGDLRIRWDEDSGHVMMTGPAVTVFDGELAH